MKHARAILWAQWRTIRNFYPRAGVGWTALIGAVWYGFWLIAAIAGSRLVASPDNLNLVKTALPGAMLIVFLYWQVVPLLMAATGASLDLRKLQGYPIPPSQLFSIEVMLRVTAGVEMILILAGIALGIVLNPDLSIAGAIAIIPYILFNLLLAVGLRDVLLRLLAHKRIREVVFFLLIMAAAIPRFLISREPSAASHLSRVFEGDSWIGWPWSAAASLTLGLDAWKATGILLAWTLAVGIFSRWQFDRTLSFDRDAAEAGDSQGKTRLGILERFYRLPSALFSDPMAALIEKELRFLVRSPRFRLVFLMGFTFGVVTLLPISLGRGNGVFLGTNYLTLVSVYALLLLSEACFWNSFGFDRSAAQIYFLAPVPFWRVLVAKNISALFFIALEIAAVTTVCALLGMPLGFLRLAEAFAVSSVVTIFLLCAGNLMSIHRARGVNPATQLGRKAAGRVQAMLFIIYPIAFFPAALAYLARWAFDQELAFFAVLAFDAIAGLIVYRIALDSAAQAAERLKESMISSLSAADGPIAG
jgi:ABC-2 type transport system permease protein